MKKVTIEIGYNNVYRDYGELSINFGNGTGITVQDAKKNTRLRVAVGNGDSLGIEVIGITSPKDPIQYKVAKIKVELIDSAGKVIDNKTIESSTSWHKIWPF